jgi:hypothetical protein
VPVRAPRDVYVYLRDGAGSNNVARDFSGALDGTFVYVPTVETEIQRILVQIKDTVQVVADNYGGIAALANGIRVRVRDIDSAVVVLDLCDGEPPKTNGAWARKCFDVSYSVFGAGDQYVDVRWTFAKSGKPLFLYPGEQLEVFTDEDLSGLTGHTFFIMGQERE